MSDAPSWHDSPDRSEIEQILSDLHTMPELTSTFKAVLADLFTSKGTISELKEDLLDFIISPLADEAPPTAIDLLDRLNYLVRKYYYQSLGRSADRASANLNGYSTSTEDSGTNRGNRTLEVLIQDLDNANTEVRHYAAWNLGQTQDVRAVEPLLAALKKNIQDNSFRGSIQSALRQLGRPAVPALIEALQDVNPDVRSAVCWVLGEIYDERALPALQEIKENDTAVDKHGETLKAVAALAMRQINPYTVDFDASKLTRHNISPFTPEEAKFNWEALLHDWSVALMNYSDLMEEPSPEQIEAQWLGYPPATEEQILALEERLGTQLPPSYRAFLKVSNGWGKITSFIDNLWSTEEIDWFAVRNQGYIDGWSEIETPMTDEEYFVYGEEQTYSARAEYWQTLLEISDNGDAAFFLLNPQIVTAEGEWEAWFFAGWLPGVRRYRSFWEMMQAEFKGFLRMQ